MISYGGSNGTSSIAQIRLICAGLSMIDSNAVIQLRDIFSRTHEESFEGHEFDNKAVKSVVNKLIQYSNV